MDWLASNWIWLVLAFGAFALLARGGGCGMGHGRHHHDNQSDSKLEAPRRETTAAKARADQRTPSYVDHRHG